MASSSVRQRNAAGTIGQRRSQSSQGGKGSQGSGDGDGGAGKPSTGEKPAKGSQAAGAKGGAGGDKAMPSGNKRSLTFAVGGVLTLMGVVGYTLLRQPGAGGSGRAPADTLAATGTMPVQTPLQSVEAKRASALKSLDGLSHEQRREKAKSLGMLTEEEVDAILHEKESSWCLNPPPPKRGGTIRLRVDTNQVSSNSPIEDYLAWAPLGPAAGAGETSTKDEASRYMFSVFDGHAGYMCAAQLSTRLGPMLNESLEVVGKLADSSKGKKATDVNSKELVKAVRDLAGSSRLEWDQVPLALTATFIRMDYDLVHGALAEFRRAQDVGRMDELLGPAVSGSCGLVAVVDTAASEVVVANTGDSRALLGVRLKDGRWKAVRLSEDQTGKNPREEARLIREHPGESPLVRGRVLGALMPTRAFGDCRYKWPLEAQQDLFPVLYSRGHRYATTPSDYATPPYVTAKPVIVKHQLSDSDKFIVIASDGLYDQLSDAEVVDTVAQWFEANAEEPGRHKESTLMTSDKNAATHLIRTALSTDRLGRRSDIVLRRLLAIPPPHSRRFRDDISVTIVTLNRD
ncbi:hypothetical protein LPJ61_002687 [Coemansia biformis]|uniref:PPM-type phosphatase domain-containing protein n=1 Tax=Coemansia biformis TaxID=1286918 RepID=A0A9W7YDJ8_9FUNG|nr:hypothetical protein LPJ61_002687 [Coemansia biformis]